MVESRFKLLISEEAGDEIYDLYEFYEEVSSGLGDRYMDQLGNCLASLQEKPHQWQYANTAQEKNRRAILKSPQVVILYLVKNQDVEVLSEKEARSDWLK
ncbi:MAG: hypothetical protein AAFY70_16725 [Bacteroidota bacterium]